MPRLRSLFCLALVLSCLAPDAAAAGSLDEELARADHELFQAAFVACDAAKIYTFLTDDIEFYHDQAGASIGSQVRSDFENLTRNCPAKRGIRRELVPGTLRSFPMKGGYAVQMGEHRFIQPTGPATAARFVHLWQKKDDRWRLSRVLSFDHHLQQTR